MPAQAQNAREATTMRVSGRIRNNDAALCVLWARKNPRAAWVPVSEGPKDRLQSFFSLLNGEKRILPVGKHPAGPAEQPLEELT